MTRHLIRSPVHWLGIIFFIFNGLITIYIQGFVIQKIIAKAINTQKQYKEMHKIGMMFPKYYNIPCTFTYFVTLFI